MQNWKEDVEFQNALQKYLCEHSLTLPENAEYRSAIDGVFIYTDKDMVLRVGLPPVSNYSVRETEYTDKYMRQAR
jgi:hypothetical protein